MSLEEEVLEKIKPTAEERTNIRSLADELLERSSSIISKLGIDAEPMLVGSVAKGTYLKNPDIDIFIGFPPETPREELEKRGLEVGKMLIGGRENYAEHPYIHGTYKGFEVDVVPCYRIEDGSRRMSAVDRTPFHTEYIKKHLKEQQKDEVILLKQFMKGIGVYGAEAEIEGFSGYLAELLVLYYGSFRGVLEGSLGWKRGHRLCLSEDYGNKFDGALIFVDPVDHRRNVASALSADSMALFIYAASEYLKKPDIRFFFPNKRRPESPESLIKEVKRKGTHLIGLEISKPDLVPDVLFPQIKKAKRVISQRLNDAGFTVLNSTYSVSDDNIVFAFELEVGILPSVRNHYGPPVWNEQSENFLKKWKEYRLRIESGRWLAQVPRGYTHPRDYLDGKIREWNLGKDLNEVLKDGYEIIGDEGLTKKYPEMLTELLFPAFPWEN